MSQDELEKIDLPFGLKIERDLYLDDDTTVAEEMNYLGIEVPSYFYKKREDDLYL